MGHKVLLIDIDPQANSTSGLGEEKPSDNKTIYGVITGNSLIYDSIILTKTENLHLVPSNSELSGAEIELAQLEEREFQLKKALESIREEFDYIFIDCPPSLGLLTVNALAASDFLAIPLQCEYYALEGLGQLLRTYSLVKKNLNPNLELGAVLLTMADFRTKLTDQVIEEVRNYFKEKVLSSIIPRSVRLSEAPSFGKPGVIYDKSSRGAKSYLKAAREFVDRFPRHAKSKSVDPAISNETVTQKEAR